MEEPIRNAVFSGCLVLAIGAASQFRRWGWVFAALLLGSALLSGLRLGVLPLDAWGIWAACFPLSPLFWLLAWLALAMGAQRLASTSAGKPSALLAFSAGAAWGGVPVGVGLAQGRRSPETARLLLLAMAGGLCGPLGNAAAFLLLPESQGMPLWPLGLLLAALVFPWRAGLDWRGARRASPVLFWGVLPLWALACWVSSAWALAVGLVVVWSALLLQRRSGARRPASQGGPWTRLLAGLGRAMPLLAVLVLVPSGALAYLAENSWDIGLELGPLLAVAVGAVSLLVGVLLGGAPLALAGSLAAVSDPVALGPAFRAGIVCGAVLGGVLPVLAANGLLAKGWRPWLLQASVALAYLACWSLW